MGQVRGQERAPARLNRKPDHSVDLPLLFLAKHMRSSIRGFIKNAACQNYSVTLQGKFNKAPTAKTH